MSNAKGEFDENMLAELKNLTEYSDPEDVSDALEEEVEVLVEVGPPKHIVPETCCQKHAGQLIHSYLLEKVPQAQVKDH